MDKTIVGNNAGKVWYALKEIGEISAQLQISVAYFCSIGLYFLV